MRVVLYVPGIGDHYTVVRRLATIGWYLYGVRPVVHRMDWSDGRPFAIKLQSLLQHIDRLVATGHRVSLVGESAGASAAIHAYAARPQAVQRVVCLCGKLKHPQSIRPSVLLANPAFGESMALLPHSLVKLDDASLARVRSIHPLRDSSVPIDDTQLAGAEWRTIPSVGHAASIIAGNTLFSYLLVPFLKRKV
ncbi:MAG TPA: hypothetical protein VLE99_00630 [Candidatus Saccharimonadales bacterium]|nr:hypothetical protein [Candidatus Saccharimonadales bacterium]